MTLIGYIYTRSYTWRRLAATLTPADVRLHSQTQSVSIFWPVPMLLGDRRICVWTSCLRLSHDSNPQPANGKFNALTSRLYCQATLTVSCLCIIHCVPKKTWQYIWHYNSGKTRSIFYNFCIAVSRNKRFTHSWKYIHLTWIFWIMCVRYRVKVKQSHFTLIMHS